MQLALAAGSTGRGTSDSLPTTRATRLLAAGIALAGAGVIAVNPVAPLVPVAGTHHAAVELTATTAENIDALMDLLSGPNPINAAIGELSNYYSDIARSSLERTWDGIEGIWYGQGAARGLEAILPEIIEHLQQGDVSQAWNLVNWDLLFGVQNVFQPLFNFVPRGGGDEVPGIFGIGTDLTRAFANVQDLFDDWSFWTRTLKSLTEPLVGFAFALADNLTDNSEYGHVAQDPLDALLNGYVPWASDDTPANSQWWGLLSPNGTFAYFVDYLPGRIADALTADLPEVDAGGALADVNLLDTGAADGSLLDLGWLDGLFT